MTLIESSFHFWCAESLMEDVVVSAKLPRELLSRGGGVIERLLDKFVLGNDSERLLSEMSDFGQRHQLGVELGQVCDAVFHIGHQRPAPGGILQPFITRQHLFGRLILAVFREHPTQFRFNVLCVLNGHRKRLSRGVGFAWKIAETDGAKLIRGRQVTCSGGGARRFDDGFPASCHPDGSEPIVGPRSRRTRGGIAKCDTRWRGLGSQGIGIAIPPANGSRRSVGGGVFMCWEMTMQ